MTLHAFWVWPVEWETGKEFCCHATALAWVVTVARCARPGRFGFAQRQEQVARLPYLCKSAFAKHRACFELIVNNERARIHIANRVDQTNHATSTTQIEAGKRLAQRIEMEERISRQHVVTGLVTIAVVVGLEMIDVTQQQGQTPLLTLRLTPQAGQLAIEAAPIVPRERRLRVGAGSGILGDSATA